MAQEKTTTIKMMYSGKLEYITLQADAKYEDFLEIAFERFEMPVEFRNFIQVSNELRYVFDKDTFEYFILLFPNPEIIFFMLLDYTRLLGKLRGETREPLANKRIREDEGSHGATLTRQNCFMGSLPGNESLEEPKAKRSRADYISIRRPSALKRTSSRSIRI